MKYICIYLLLLATGLTSTLVAQSPLQQLTGHAALRHASVGICIKDLTTGKIVVAHQADKAFTPASVLKIVTTATALETLGANYRYTTRVVLDANHPQRIVVVGAGDPSLASSALKEDPELFFVRCADTLKRKLPRNRKYSLYIADELFGYDGVSPEWTWIDLGNAYAAAAYGISVFDNMYKVYLNTTDRRGCPKIVRTEPRMHKLKFTNLLTTNTTGRDNGYIYGIPFSNDRVLRGNIPAGRSEFALKGDIPDPGMMLAETLATYLKQTGTAIERIETARATALTAPCNTNRAPSYRAGQTLYAHPSRPLTDLIREVNVNSNNHYAEHLIRTLGRRANASPAASALDAGTTYIARYWEQKGMAVGSLRMEDGCGLAPQNGVSPQLLVDILAYMQTKSRHADAFAASLPVAGRDGTVKNFMKQSRHAGKIRVKSGSIGGVQCYSGYLLDGKQKYAFAIMINKFNAPHPDVRKAIERFMEQSFK